MKSPKVSIIILNWNNYWDTIECIRSLEKATYPNLDILIVDNSSDNDSEVILRKEFPSYVFKQTGINLGFAGGNNIGIRQALKKGADYILLLNSDTVVKENFLEPLINAGEHVPDVGILGGKTYNYYDKKRLCSAGANLNWLKGTAAFHRGEGKLDKGSYNKKRYVNFIPGYFMLIKAAVFEKCGFLDERYFLGVEEIDFCLRIGKAGFILLYVPDAEVWHKVTASHKKYAPKFIYNGYRNKLIFMKKYLPAVVWPIWFALFRAYVLFVAPFRLKTVSNKIGEELSLDSFKKASKLAFKERHKEGVTLQDLQNVEMICSNGVTVEA